MTYRQLCGNVMVQKESLMGGADWVGRDPEDLCAGTLLSLSAKFFFLSSLHATEDL